MQPFDKLRTIGRVFSVERGGSDVEQAEVGRRMPQPPGFAGRDNECVGWRDVVHAAVIESGRAIENEPQHQLSSVTAEHKGFTMARP